MTARVVAPKTASSGPGGPLSASGEVATANLVWVMNHGLGYNPAGHEFWSDTGNRMEPAVLTHINVNTTTAEWLEPVAGSWNLS